MYFCTLGYTLARLLKEHRLRLILLLVLLLSACASERHFAMDSLWPFGNPNAPPGNGETMQRALGKTAVITPIAPQAGNVWPGPVQPVPTISDTEAHMGQPLGQAYTPSLPSPYPPGETPPDDADTGPGWLGVPGAPDYTVPTGAVPKLVPASPPSPP